MRWKKPAASVFTLWHPTDSVVLFLQLQELLHGATVLHYPGVLWKSNAHVTNVVIRLADVITNRNIFVLSPQMQVHPEDAVCSLMNATSGRVRVCSMANLSFSSEPGPYGHKPLLRTQGCISHRKVKVKLSLCLTKHHAMKTYWGSWGIVPRILNLCTILRWVVSFMHRLLYPRGKSPRYPLDRRLDGPQIRFGRGGEEKNSQPPPKIEP